MRALSRYWWMVLLVMLEFVFLAASDCGTTVESTRVSTNEELVNAVLNAKPLRAEWMNGTDTEPMFEDLNGDGHAFDELRLWGVYGGTFEVFEEAGLVIAVVNVEEDLGGGNYVWTDGYVTTISRSASSSGPFDGRIPLVEISDLNGDGADDLLLRWTDSFGSSLDTEVYSWSGEGMKCIEGCD